MAQKASRDDILLDPDFGNLNSVLLNLNFQQKETFTEIINWLQALVPNFQDLILQSTPEAGQNYVAWSEKGWNRRYLHLKWASEGMLRLLCLLAILFNDEKPALLLLDEPEVGFHPAVRQYVADFVQAAAGEGTQVVMMTHDSDILRQFEVADIFYFKRQDQTTQVTRLANERALTDTIEALNDAAHDAVANLHKTNSLYP